MNSSRIGRNDPCHCGSGKKYKRCHMAEDEQHARAASRESSAPSNANQPRLSTKEPEPELIAAYLGHREAIESACRALEAHRAEFDALLDDEPAYMARVEKLFSEEPFAPMRFRAADIERAFATVGYPSAIAVNEQTTRVILKAILFLAGKSERTALAMRLLMILPGYVAKGQFLDAWLIHDCASWMAESPKESNPFLFEMLRHGLLEWYERRHAKDIKVFGEMGVDVEKLREMRPEELDDWFAKHLSDPNKLTQIESLLSARTDLRATAEANFCAMETEAARLLEREDARELLLSPEEVRPWLPVFEERFQAESHKFASLLQGRKPNKATTKGFGEVFMPLIAEMAGTIFTPARVEQLKIQLRTCREKWFAAGEKEAVHRAHGVLMLLQQEVNSSDNYFLFTLCYASLRSMVFKDRDEPL